MEQNANPTFGTATGMLSTIKSKIITAYQTFAYSTSLHPLTFYICIFVIAGLIFYFIIKYMLDKQVNKTKHVRFTSSVYIKSFFDSVVDWFSTMYKNIQTQFNKILLNSYMSEGGIKTRMIAPNSSVNRFIE